MVTIERVTKKDEAPFKAGKAYTCCYGKGDEGGRIGGLVDLGQEDVEAIYKLMV